MEKSLQLRKHSRLYSFWFLGGNSQPTIRPASWTAVTLDFLAKIYTESWNLPNPAQYISTSSAEPRGIDKNVSCVTCAHLQEKLVSKRGGREAAAREDASYKHSFQSRRGANPFWSFIGIYNWSHRRCGQHCQVFGHLHAYLIPTVPHVHVRVHVHTLPKTMMPLSKAPTTSLSPKWTNAQTLERPV